jgi:hypothetical protein
MPSYRTYSKSSATLRNYWIYPKNRINWFHHKFKFTIFHYVQTHRSDRQTMWTLIKLLYWDQSDQSLHYTLSLVIRKLRVNTILSVWSGSITRSIHVGKRELISPLPCNGMGTIGLLNSVRSSVRPSVRPDFVSGLYVLHAWLDFDITSHNFSP